MAGNVSGYWTASHFLQLPEYVNGTNVTNSQAILPGDPLYALKLSFEQLDLSFTANTTKRVDKEVHYTENRLVEAEIARKENRTDSADEALRQYSEELNETLKSLSEITRNTSDNSHIQFVLSRHLAVLNHTISKNPGRSDLLEEYNRTSSYVEKIRSNSSTQNNSTHKGIDRVRLSNTSNTETESLNGSMQGKTSVNGVTV